MKYEQDIHEILRGIALILKEDNPGTVQKNIRMTRSVNDAVDYVKTETGLPRQAVINVAIAHMMSDSKTMEALLTIGIKMSASAAKNALKSFGFSPAKIKLAAAGLENAISREAE